MRKEEFEKVAKFEVTDVVFEKVINPAYNAIRNYTTIEEFVKMFNVKNLTEDEIVMKDAIKQKRNDIYNEFMDDLRWVACIDDGCYKLDVIMPVNFTFPAYVQAYVINAKCDIIKTEYLANFIKRYTKLFGKYDELVAEYEAKFNKKYKFD